MKRIVLFQETTMNKVTTTARVLLGAMFLVFGLNFFFNFFAMPSPSGKAGELAGAMYSSGYLLHATKAVEAVTGALLLTGVLVPLALVLLAPVVVNIALFNFFLTDPSQWPIPAVAVALQVYLMWAYRDYYRSLFTVQASPSAATATMPAAVAAAQAAS
jgi:uncharacterized membrane protein YphA (DoxX/SURF4 family)